MKKIIKTALFGFFALVFLSAAGRMTEAGPRITGCVLGALLVFLAVKPWLPSKKKTAEPETIDLELQAMAEEPEKVDYPFTSIPPKEAIKAKDYIVFDTETTGFSPREDKIVELTALKIRNGEVSRFTTLINPERRIPQRTIAIHGITDKAVSGKPTFPQVVTALDAFLEPDLPIVGHNVTFDLRFLWWAYHDAGQELLPRKYIDTYRLSKRAFPDRSTYSLASLITDLALMDGEQTHRTDDDVNATKALFLQCCERLTK